MAAARAEPATTRATVGFIGVGTMGAPMSRNLARAGFGPGHNHSEIVRWLESRAGSEIGAPA